MSANAVLEIIIPIDISNSLVIKKLRKIGVEVVGLNGIQIHPPEEKKPFENFAEELRYISTSVKNYQHEENIDNWYAAWSEKYLEKIKEFNNFLSKENKSPIKIR
jgi:phosphomannomutase